MINGELNAVFNQALNLAKRNRHEYLTIEHLFFTLLHNEEIGEVIKSCGGDVNTLRIKLTQYLRDNLRSTEEELSHEPFETLALSRVIEAMLMHMKNADKKEATTIDFLIAIYSEEKCYSTYLLQSQGIDKIDIIELITENAIDSFESENTKSEKEKQESYLDMFALNLTKIAQEGGIDPVIGREREIERSIEILCRRKKNNPILVGEPGVGKTAIAEGLALKIVETSVPSILKKASLFALDMGSLLAGTKYRGDFEKRLKGVVDEIIALPNALLFIDEIHTIVGAGAASGGSMDASNILKPALANGKIKCIGATTYNEFRSFFDKDKALSRRFAKIDIEEPSIEVAIEILEGLKESYERHHDVKYSKDALKAAVELSYKHINDRFLPDKAIDVIDEAGAAFHLKEPYSRNVTKLHIEEVVSKIAHIPQINLNSDDIKSLKGLESRLKKRIFGQDRAIEIVVDSIKRARAGLLSPNSPIGSFLFSGPTGVGKTELAKELASLLGVHFERVDMSEYMEKHTISRLIGAPAGYVGYEQGGLLTETIRKHPYSLLLLDEIEKAHPDLVNVLLQVMDNATLTDNNGLKANFKNVIIVMTSNLGSLEPSVMGFTKEESGNRDSAIKNFFSPEFRNRLDAIINFSHLELKEIKNIAKKYINDLNILLVEKKVTLVVSDQALTHIAKIGYDKELGARPLSKVIDTQIKSKLTDEILFGKLKSGGVAKVGIKDGALKIEIA